MTTPELRKGEKIEVTIRAEVKSAGRALALAIPGGGSAWISGSALASDAVTVTRTTPAQWPPKPGDVWLDAKGQPWFVIANQIAEDGVVIVSSTDRTLGHAAKTWLGLVPAPTLAYRVGEACADEVHEFIDPAKVKIGSRILVHGYLGERLVEGIETGEPVEIYHRDDDGRGPLRTLTVHKGGQVERIRGGAS